VTGPLSIVFCSEYCMMCKVQNSSMSFLLRDVLIFSEIKLVIVIMFLFLSRIGSSLLSFIFIPGTNWCYFNFCVLGVYAINPLNPELNPICYLLALLGAHHFLHVSRIRVKSLTFRRLMSYIYGAPILDVSRSHTTTQHSR